MYQKDQKQKTNRNSIYYAFLTGMSAFCGGASKQIKDILNRSVEDGFKQDMEAIGGDMWNTLEKVDQDYRILSKNEA